ncbi:MAG: TSCPD domain-containing protein, partial [Intestinibacter sp.]|uniref:TSCPD domain-containing protein n=1 Tax=Intestinibacter sp. TaxID=1965304 RepID=UPI003F17B671
MYRYYTKGVCAKSILMDIDGDVLLDVVFEGGCEGALIAIKNLVRGKNIDYIIDTLEQIP